ncbi:hypothetical protein DL98DRAFT_99208 [Cadophora sp. DSE1049]|nr:hypothetical protein DL98DRAFT_99208 [Cadophora sp. DSE1049]
MLWLISLVFLLLEIADITYRLLYGIPRRKSFDFHSIFFLSRQRTSGLSSPGISEYDQTLLPPFTPLLALSVFPGSHRILPNLGLPKAPAPESDEWDFRLRMNSICSNYAPLLCLSWDPGCGSCRMSVQHLGLRDNIASALHTFYTASDHGRRTILICL